VQEKQTIHYCRDKEVKALIVRLWREINMTGQIKKANMQRELDALAFSVLLSFRQQGAMQWTDWFETTRTRRGRLGLGTGTFSETVKRLTAEGRVQVDKDGCYRVVLDAVGDDVGLSPDTNAAAVEPKRCSEVSEALPEVLPPLPAALQEAMAEIEKLRAENEQLLNWITGDSDALTCLQAIYQNPASSEHTKIKAATGALPFERPKLTASIGVVMDFRERVKQARLKATAKLIEHIPDTPEPAA
jgi:hypothetical protein